MGEFQQIRDLLEHSVPEFSNMKLVPRGTPIFPDLLLSGSIKFARRTGANFAALNVDNQFSLTADAEVSQQLLRVNRILPWLQIGGLVTFNQTQMLEIETWDPVNLVIQLSDPLGATQTSGTVCTLWAVPLPVVYAAVAGQTQLIVKSQYQLLNGDAITLPVSPVTINSLQEITIQTANTAGSSGDPDYPYLFNLQLSQPLPIAVDSTSSVYLRCYPGYISNVMTVPLLQTAQAVAPMGPFIMDFVASPLDSVTSYPEYFSIRTLDGGGNPVQGTDSSLMAASRNFPVWYRPILAQNMIFWTVIRGSGGFISPNQYRLISGLDLRGRVSTRLVPPIPPGATWTFTATSPQDSGLLVIYQDAVGYQSFPLNPGPNLITFQNTSTQPLNRLDFLINFRNLLPPDSPPDALNTSVREVDISDMAVPNPYPTVNSIQYSYVFRVLGATNFQATSLVLKPYFLSLSDLTDLYDNGQFYNSGLLYD